MPVKGYRERENACQAKVKDVHWILRNRMDVLSWRQLCHDAQAQDEQRDEHRKKNSETHPQQIRQ